jgi:hypothetical protein
LLTIGGCKKKIFLASRIIFSSHLEDDYDHPQVSQAIAEIRASLNDLEILGIENLPLNISSDDFLDYLINCIRNDVISFQRFLSKTRCTRKKILLSEINLLKNDYQGNYEAIFNIEAILNRLHDDEMKLAIEKFRHFELVNSEKITPEFLKLANNANVDYSLDAICKDDGTRFPSEKERETFIIDQFSKTYETPPPL